MEEARHYGVQVAGVAHVHEPGERRRTAVRVARPHLLLRARHVAQEAVHAVIVREVLRHLRRLLLPLKDDRERPDLRLDPAQETLRLSRKVGWAVLRLGHQTVKPQR